ncbi:LysR family transcriptional regulator [Longispora sp. NPDC051575]|uniref:LysR family transcriptional regulator n=1 Tax=Longispora sp. NPDC051575 TaxID=3154943 RepID=UPI0034232247
MGTRDDSAPDEWECRQFIAVAEHQGFMKAADELRRETGRPVQRQTISRTVAKIEEWYGERLLTREGPKRRLYPTGPGQRFLDSARSVLAEYQVMRGGESSTGGPRTLACLPHHTGFVARAEDLLLERGGPGVRVVYLDQASRGDAGFHENALGRLRERRYAWIIGPDVRDPVCASVRLYTAQLEAMVPADYDGDAMTVTELVNEHQMLAPPRDMRSRRLLEESIRRWGIADPGPRVRVLSETYESATSVMRIRNEHHRPAGRSRVVVVPSDVALAYKRGREFAGLNADKFRWVPLYHRDEAGVDHLLTLDVFVTTARSREPEVLRVVEALREAVRAVDGSGEVGLSGEPFRAPPAVL